MDEIPVPLDTVVVSATRGEVPAFAAPAAIATVESVTIRSAGPMVNLSEALTRIPGISSLNRQNYAQDLQLSIRGFGARSTFGIRGVRVIVDGIPATTPDGQGQVSNVSLASAARVEVLRGPLALLYGNAAGGVVQVFTQTGADQPTVTVSGAAGPYGLGREGVGYATSFGDHALTMDASHFETHGYRDHSDARRELFNAKWTWRPSEATRIDTVVNLFDQPVALDPLGLTRAQFEDNPRQAPAIAFTQDARKSVRQNQAGVVVEHVCPEDTISARVYAGRRDLDNKLSVPPAAQAPPTSAGGIVAFTRDYEGGALHWAHRLALGEGIAARIVAGVEADRMRDDRQGYLNTNGVRGALRRDEIDRAQSTDALLQASADVGERWSAIAGVRASRVAFETQDRYIAPGNPDDSGTLVYRATNPVAGVSFHATPRWNLYANAGRGFETPTFTELAYRPNASGLNTALRASRGNHLELGTKWRGEAQSLDAAVFDIRTQDEIVVDTNVGGRSTFRNAGGTHRRGIEVGHAARWSPWLRSSFAATLMRVRFDDGKVLPGTPESNAFFELVATPRGALETAVEVVHVGRIMVNDANEDAAPAVTLVNLRLKYTLRAGDWVIEPLFRIDNATDRRYAGSVIVNEANKRYFEPAPPRTWLLAVTARWRS